MCKETGLPEEKTLLLQHMLLSHHGKREMGAVTLPAIPEASILHHVDCMDAEMYMFRSAREETKPGEMSDKIFALDCRVYNPKKLNSNSLFMPPQGGIFFMKYKNCQFIEVNKNDRRDPE